jgi:hypothetical protein
MEHFPPKCRLISLSGWERSARNECRSLRGLAADAPDKVIGSLKSSLGTFHGTPGLLDGVHGDFADRCVACDSR